MNYCPNCGEKLSEDFTFCPNCGATVSEKRPGIAKSNTGNEGNKGKRITVGGLVTMLFCFAGAAFCFFMAFSPWELRLFYIFGDSGYYINMIVFAVIGVAAVVFGIREFFSKDKLF